MSKVWEKDNKRFCILPFSHFSPRADGKVKLCSECRYFEGIPKSGTVDEIDMKTGLIPGIEPFNLNEGDTLEDIWDSEFYKDIRRKMLDGEHISLCEQCYHDDNIAGHENLIYPIEDVFQPAPITQSKRWSLTYGQEFVNDYKDIIQYADDNNGHMGEHLPQRYEMRLSNKCNLACRMCSPENSSLFAKEIVNNKELFTWTDVKKWEKYLPGKLELDENPELIDSIIKALPNMHFLELLGGEPTLHNGIWKVIQAAVDTGHASHIIIDGHTNLQKLEEWQIELLTQFKRIKLGISIDAYKEENHYIRWPANWDIIEEKMKLLSKLKKENSWIRVHSVLQFFNAPTFYKLCQWVDEINTEHDLGLYHSMDKVVLNLIYRAELLPKDLRLEGASKLKQFVDSSNLCNVNSPYKAQRYGKDRVKQQRLVYNSMIEYLSKDYDINELNKGLGSGGWRKYNYDILLKSTLALDKVRKISYKDVFPHLPALEDLSVV